MCEVKATSALPWLGAIMIIAALMEWLSLQNDMVRMVFYWPYIPCSMGVALLLLSMWPVEMPSWKQKLFVPSALFCFLMPFFCWRERTLAEGLHSYACCQLIFVALFWLLFAVIDIMREMFPEKRSLKWLRQLLLYGMLVPCCALIVANFGTIVKDRGFDLLSKGFWIIWSRTNLGMSSLRYFMVLATLLVSGFCVSLRKTSEIETSPSEIETTPQED